MAKGCWIARVDVADAEAYKALASPPMRRRSRAKFGGRFLGARWPLRESRGWQPHAQRTCLEFPSYQAARSTAARSTDYQGGGAAAPAGRRASTWSSIEGYGGAAAAADTLAPTSGSSGGLSWRLTSAAQRDRHVPRHPALHRRRLVRRRPAAPARSINPATGEAIGNFA